MRLKHAAIAAVAAPGGRAGRSSSDGRRRRTPRADVSGTARLAQRRQGRAGQLPRLERLVQPEPLRRRGFRVVLDRPLEDGNRGGVSSSAELRVYTPTVIDGRTASLSSTYAFGHQASRDRPAVPVLRNVWVHPFAGAGLDLTWEQTDRTDEIYWSQPVRTTTHPRQTEWLTRPFATFGLKAYITPRAFFRTDMKLVFDKGIDEALVRFGLGVDF